MRKTTLLSLEEILAKATKVHYPLRGIYFLIVGKEIIYIGRTPNVFRRVGEHLANKKPDAFFLLQAHPKLTDKALALLERRYIDAFKPRLNIQKGFWENSPKPITGPSPVRGSSSATVRALLRVEQGSTAYAAAKAERINLSTIYRALKRQRAAKK